MHPGMKERKNDDSIRMCGIDGIFSVSINPLGRSRLALIGCDPIRVRVQPCENFAIAIAIESSLFFASTKTHPTESIEKPIYIKFFASEQVLGSDTDTDPDIDSGRILNLPGKWDQAPSIFSGYFRAGCCLRPRRVYCYAVIPEIVE